MIERSMILDHRATSNKWVAGNSCVNSLRKSRAAATRARLHIRAQAYTAQPLDHSCIQCLVCLVPAKRWIFMQFQRQTFSGVGPPTLCNARSASSLRPDLGRGIAPCLSPAPTGDRAAPCPRRALVPAILPTLRIHACQKIFLQNKANEEFPR